MIEKVNKVKDGSDVSTSLKTAKLSNVRQQLSMKKVIITMNSEKLSVADSNQQLQEIIQLKTIYPR